MSASRGAGDWAMRFKQPVEMLHELGTGAVRVQFGKASRRSSWPQRVARAAARTRVAGAMERIAGDGVELCYETFGDRSDQPVLLIMGLGVQMLGWDAELCELLAGRGFRVVRFDNRDVGRSTMIEGGRRPDLMAAAMGDASSASYTLDEMADDCSGLLDHLGVEAVHVVGASQGG